VNHKSAPVELRELVAFDGAALETALPQLRGLPGVDEVVVVSTCNRVEVYVAGDPDRAPAEVAAFLHRFHDLTPGTLDEHLVHRADDDAALHLFRVASALDAIVVGEPQILGQVKEAFFHAVRGGTVGSTVTRVFHRAFSAAKRVRTETRVAASAANVSSAGVNLATRIFGDLAGLGCVLVGAGDMGELAARHFAKAGARLTVANRSMERATRLAHEHGGVARDLAELPRLLIEADVVLVSTGAPAFVITADMVRAASKARRFRPLLLVDISVPRNVDPRAADLANTYLYDVDDLASVVDENLAKRASEAVRAEEIVREELKKAKKELAEKRAVPLIKALRDKLTVLAEAEAAKTLAVLGEGASEKQKKSVQAMAQSIVNKALHEPLMKLKAAAAADDDALIAAAAALFDLQIDDDAGAAAAADRALQEAEAAEAVKEAA
jgi:glutamyl-tRNA reductase